MDLISIVVPVYNAEEHLEETLRSIAEQDYRNLEVIMIDDGSADRSAAICLRQEQNDERFHYHYIQNAGPGNARNVGIELASGKYIGFCDSDDLLDSSMYSLMLQRMQQNDSDLVLCDIYSERDGRCFGFPWSDNTVFQEDEIEKTVIASMVGNRSDNDSDVPVWGSVVRALYKAELIRENGVAFPTDINFAEDLVFSIRYLRCAKRVSICDIPFYYYRSNKSSIMFSHFRYQEEMLNQRKKLVNYIGREIDKMRYATELRKRLKVTSRCYFHECVGNCCRMNDKRGLLRVYQDLRRLLNDDDVIAAFKTFDVKFGRKRLIYSLIKYRMAGIIEWYYSIRLMRREMSGV